MATQPPDTPFRRSQRSQAQIPIPSDLSSLKCSWDEGPTEARPAVLDDFHPDDDPTIVDDNEYDEIETQIRATTRFYRSFTRRPKKTAATKRGKGKGLVVTRRNEQFKVAHTVLVANPMKSDLTPAVIISMWEVIEDGEDDSPAGGDVLGHPIKIRIHWFIKPSQLPSFRAKREHIMNEIYYTLDKTEVVSPDQIVAHCDVTSEIPVSILGPDEFHCKFTVDDRKNYYYRFNWERHLKARTKEPFDDTGRLWCIEVVSGNEDDEEEGEEEEDKVLDEVEDEDAHMSSSEPKPNTKAKAKGKGKTRPGRRKARHKSESLGPASGSGSGSEEDEDERMSSPTPATKSKLKPLPKGKGKGKQERRKSDRKPPRPASGSGSGSEEEEMEVDELMSSPPPEKPKPTPRSKGKGRQGRRKIDAKPPPPASGSGSGSEEDDDDRRTPSPKPQKKTKPKPAAKGRGRRGNRKVAPKPPQSDIGDGSGEERSSESGEEGSEAVIPSDEEPSSSEFGEEESEYSEEDESVAIEDEESDIELGTSTPRRRKRGGVSTPRATKRMKTLAVPTPHSKAALRARARAKRSRSKGKAVLSRLPVPRVAYEGGGESKNANLSCDPWTRAMQVLHVGSRPDVLPCREEEYGKIMHAVESLLEEGSGGCVYVAGVPGTGKTATVHAVVRELKRMAEANEANPFTYVEINGLKIPEPSTAYSLLWEAVSGHDASRGRMNISAKEALKQLVKYFGQGRSRGPSSHACIILMDELDQLVTTKQDVVYNFFNWPTITGSKLIVVAVANTMDLPERVMSGRVRSRLGLERVTFTPYSTPQLEKIVHARLKCLEDIQEEGKEKVVVLAPDGIKFACMKTSSISGDARRVLDICRRAVELVQPQRRAARTEDVKGVVKQMQNSPTAAFLQDCTLHERIMLASLLKCVRRDGVEQVKWGDVQYQHLIYVNILTGDGDSNRKPSTSELSLILDSLLGSHAVIIEDGTIASRKSDGERKMVLNVEQNEVERVLTEMGGQNWVNAIGHKE